MKKQWIILSAAASVVVMAGFSAILDLPDSGKRDTTFSRSSSIARTGVDEVAGRSRDKRIRNADHSFQQRSMEIDATKQTTERDDSIRKLAQEWAGSNAMEAEHWAGRFTEEADRIQALNLVCLSFAKRSPAEAIAMVERNHLGGALVEEIIGGWANGDFAGASKWVAESTLGDNRNTMLAKLALSRAETAPEEAASLVALSMSEGPIQEEAAMSVLHQWLRKDQQAAAEWINGFPDGPLKERRQMEIEGMRKYVGGR